MHEYKTAIAIEAPPQAIWHLLTDAPRYAEWNRAVERIDGRIALNETIKVHAPVNPGRVFPVRVAELDEPRRMVWSGGMPLGLFKGERTFELTPLSGIRTQFGMREVYTGLLAGIMFRQIPDLTEAFEQFATSLKQAAEGHTVEGQ